MTILKLLIIGIALFFIVLTGAHVSIWYHDYMKHDIKKLKFYKSVLMNAFYFAAMFLISGYTFMYLKT